MTPSLEYIDDHFSITATNPGGKPTFILREDGIEFGRADCFEQGVEGTERYQFPHYHSNRTDQNPTGSIVWKTLSGRAIRKTKDPLEFLVSVIDILPELAHDAGYPSAGSYLKLNEAQVRRRILNFYYDIQ